MPRHLLRTFACLLAVTLVACAQAQPARPAAAQGDKPNVLFIAIDDLKPLIGAYGDELAQTPNLDRLAARGVVFTNAHCQQAVCAPSRVSLMLGLRPDTTRVWDLQTQFRPILPDAVTLPQRFHQAGYHSVGMGKIYDPRSAGGARQMDTASWSEPYVDIQSSDSATFSYLNPETAAHIRRAREEAGDDWPRGWNNQLALVFPDGKPATDRADVADSAYHDGAMTDVAIERLRGFADSGEAFFLAVGYKKPHLPFNAPERYWAMYDRDAMPLAEYTQVPEGSPNFTTQPGWELRSNYNVPAEGPIPDDQQRELIHGYYACVSYIDAQVGELLDELEATGLDENTIIVVWGDHGWHLGDHDMWCKHSNFEQATRSPLIIAAPGVGAHGTTAAAPVEFIDIYPTLLDLTGLSPAGELHGVSLRPILEDAGASVKPVAMSQYPRGGGNGQMMGYAYRSDRYRLVQWRQTGEREGNLDAPIVAVELYDYQTDPLETRNLADDPAYAAARAEMEAYAEAVGR